MIHFHNLMAEIMALWYIVI